MTEPALDLDFSRYAPASSAETPRPILVTSQDSLAEPDQLSEALRVARFAFSTFWQCLWLATKVIWQRLLAWIDAHIVQSLFASWSTAGLGWGCAAGLFLLHWMG
jgi:hypothetical protein